MHEKLLMDAGLAKNEAKTYLALLKIGKSTSGKIVKEAGIAGGKVYETLYKLLDKGLVELVIENGVKKFMASDPQSIMLYMEEQKKKLMEQSRRLEKIVPDLRKVKEFTHPEENVYLIKGFRGIKPLVYNVLKGSIGESRIMGLRSSKDEKYNVFWRHWHRERVKSGKEARVLFTDRDTDYWRFFKKLKHTKTRSLTELSPSVIKIIDDHCFIYSYEEEFTCIYIKSLSIAKSLSSFFDGLWKLGKD